MADEHEIPVKVVDRRWWARGDGRGRTRAPARRRSKPTYVEELERELAEAEKQAQDTSASTARRRRSSRTRARACARNWRRTPSAAGATCSSSLLEVVDNLDRAIDAAQKAPRQGHDADPLLQGVEMVRQQFLSKLEGFGVKRIERRGGLRSARCTRPSPRCPAADDASTAGSLGVIAHGYRIGDEVLRPALVAVGKA